MKNECCPHCKELLEYYNVDIDICKNICQILKRGNTAVIKERKDDVIVIEQKTDIKHSKKK